MINTRSSGILAHITSLPSPYGIGDIGPSSYDFINFLTACEQSYWQFLPTGPTNSHLDDSPYMSASAFAGSFLLLSPDLLFQQGLISKTSLEDHPEYSPYIVNFQEVRGYKEKITREAFENFNPSTTPDYDLFISTSKWLNDYALFMALKEIYNNRGWFDWPNEIASRNPNALSKILKQNIKKINYYKFEQYLFFQQWELLHRYASDHEITLFGDLPIYVAYDSVDVWANQNIFTLDPTTFRPTHVAGVPPDYFSDTGQRWGNPLYDWQNKSTKIQKQLIDWWSERLASIFTQVDIARIDHFRGFESYWSIPEKEEFAINGEWLSGPGYSFFQKIKKRLGNLPIIAEDLGLITQEVVKLRDKLGFPGMKVLQFAFDGDPDNLFLPHNFQSSDCIVYTGTHDNDTTVGWFLSDKLNDNQRMKIKELANRASTDHTNIHRDLIYLAQSSISKLCVFPLQDILGFGNDCKMNSPGVPEGNWKWRCAREFLNRDVLDYLKASTELFGRGKPETDKKTS